MNTGHVLAFLKIAFVKNGYWKLLSLIIAVFVYFSVRSEISHLRVVTLPVETDFGAVGTGAAIESIEPRSVRVTLRGSYSDVNKLDDAEMGCVVRPKHRASSLQEAVPIKIRASNLRGVRGVRVVEIEPNAAVIRFDLPMALTLAVAPPALQGKARGLVHLVFDQTNAVVRGSRRMLSPLDAAKVRVQADAIDVDGRSQSFATRVRLFPPGGVANATVEPADMVVNVMITDDKTTARVERVPVVVTQPAGAAVRWTTDPAWVDVEVTGRAGEVGAVTFAQLIASVNGDIPVTSLSVTNEVPVTVHVQQGVEVDEVVPVPPVVKLIPVSAEPPPPSPSPAPPEGKP